MNKMSAIIFILNKLNVGTVYTKELAQELNVSTKSIQRYIKEIETADFPLYSPTKGAYHFVEGYSLEKAKLSNNEACLLVLFKSFVHSLNNESLNKSFENLKTRILQEDTINPFFIKFPEGTEYEINKQTTKIEKAIKEKEYISVKYNKNTFNNLKPIKIVNFEGFWYLICLNQKNKLFKFNVTKIEDIIETGISFEYTEDITKILKESTTIWFELKRDIVVNLIISKEIAKYFKNKQYFPLQKILKENEDGSLLVESKIARDEEIVPMILHWLPNIKVTQPKELDTKIRTIISKY